MIKTELQVSSNVSKINIDNIPQSAIDDMANMFLGIFTRAANNTANSTDKRKIG